MPPSSFCSKFSRKAIRSAPENIYSIWRPFNKSYSFCSWEYCWSGLNSINNCSEKCKERGFIFLLREGENVPQGSRLHFSMYTTKYMHVLINTNWNDLTFHTWEGKGSHKHKSSYNTQALLEINNSTLLSWASLKNGKDWLGCSKV